MREGYSEYLNSPWWAKVRALARERVDGRCEFCKRRGRVEVHHLSYERLGTELACDLIVLCARCHRDAHHFSPIEQAIRVFAAYRPPPWGAPEVARAIAEVRDPEAALHDVAFGHFTGDEYAGWRETWLAKHGFDGVPA